MRPELPISMRALAGLFVWAVLTCGSLGALSLADTLYQWTDANGVRHYTNTRPPEGVEATAVMDEIPHDPETDDQRREREESLLEEREEAEIEERLESAEEEAEAARREAEAARREAERLEDELQARDEEGAPGIYLPRRHRKHHPPEDRPPGDRRPEDRPSWYPPYDPFPTYPDKPWQQPRQAPEDERDQGRDRERPPHR